MADSNRTTSSGGRSGSGSRGNTANRSVSGGRSGEASSRSVNSGNRQYSSQQRASQRYSSQSPSPQRRKKKKKDSFFKKLGRVIAFLFVIAGEGLGIFFGKIRDALIIFFKGPGGSQDKSSNYSRNPERDDYRTAPNHTTSKGKSAALHSEAKTSTQHERSADYAPVLDRAVKQQNTQSSKADATKSQKTAAQNKKSKSDTISRNKASFKQSEFAKALQSLQNAFADVGKRFYGWFAKRFPDFEKKRQARRAKASNTWRKSSRSKDIAARVIVSLFCMALAGFILYQVYFYLYSGTETHTVMRVTVSEVIESTGVAVRNETVITGDISGVLVSSVKNGSKVFKGESIAKMYASEEDAQAAQRVSEIDEALSDFQTMSTAGEDSASELSSLEKQLRERLFTLSRNVYDGSIRDACRLRGDILYLLNKSQIATKATDGFEERVSKLTQERELLLSKYTQSPREVTSPLSGYYVNETDGYETLLNTKVLPELTPEGLDAILSQFSEKSDKSVIGKIADNYIWHIVSEVKEEDAEKLQTGKSYKIFLPYSDIKSVNAVLERINVGSDNKRALLVFKCSYMVADLTTLRIQPITIELQSCTGLEVPTASIVKVTEKKEVSSSDKSVYLQSETYDGVYVMWGNEAKIRKIDVKYIDGDYAICSEKSESGWLKMYDKVLIDAKGIYNGKIINVS